MDAARAARLRWEGFGPEDPASGQAAGEAEPPDPDRAPSPRRTARTPSDRRVEEHEREPSRQRNTAARTAYHEGRRAHAAGKPRPEADPSDEVAVAHQAGYDDARTQARAGSFDKALGGSWGGADDWAGVIVGGIVYALVLSYLKYGWAGPKAWFSSKFTNATPKLGGTTAPATPPATSGPPLTPNSPGVFGPLGPLPLSTGLAPTGSGVTV